MPQSRLVADALGVVTICLVAVLVVLGLFCIIYSFYFRSRILGQGFSQLSYFSGPWIIRITYIFFAVWWGVGEIIRLNLLRHHGRVLDGLTLEWQEKVCKGYIISNLGFAEPCLFLTLIFLLRASLQRSGTLGRKWNVKTAGFVLVYCIPLFILQLVVILIGPKYKEDHNPKLRSYFIRAASSDANHDIAFCTYPLFSTIFLGVFATIVTIYLFWLGRRILHLVINKGVGMCMLVYLPIADSLSLRSLQIDTEARRKGAGKRGSISFRATEKDETSGAAFVELSLFNPS
ncbi:uncharacterized protein LOC121759308 isoform X4 [Salvia splendens]|uniref:uncharacterized protein LOC121759308 isoform X4 n=1 Tax=Salvia splendens TaxID=180675 RepID=UPI001C27DBC9|nr:uncharacterized protein LOC121759308 isoform X4 [Salvia splendens]